MQILFRCSRWLQGQDSKEGDGVGIPLDEVADDREDYTAIQVCSRSSSDMSGPDLSHASNTSLVVDCPSTPSFAIA